MWFKDHGGSGLSDLEAGSVFYEMAKKDGSVAMFTLVHNALGMNLVNELGDEKQRAMILPEAVKMNKIMSFGLTEPEHGSDASTLETYATKTEGGWLINGRKRWIGNATWADYINVWARNPSDGNQVQCFVVTKGSKGLTTKKIENKYSFRMV